MDFRVLHCNSDRRLRHTCGLPPTVADPTFLALLLALDGQKISFGGFLTLEVDGKAREALSR